MTNGSVELLAPAGSWEAFVAAVENGAGAVYLGGKHFSARKHANNFELEEIADACRYAHLRGVRVYITVNTLLAEDELAQGVKFVGQLFNIGVDGIIVQDMGLLRLLKELLPQVEVHASTQMAVMNSYGVKLLQEQGISRVVLARELSLENIAAIHRQVPQAELEVFAHGALCFSYSGQCLMSSLIGGRSGNRGSCAQPCRLTYQLVDEKGRPATGEEVGEHLLSPKDLYTMDLLPQLIKAGVSSLKLEGRMKRPEYVATVVSTYRHGLDRALQELDSYQVESEEDMNLRQIFNRDFTSAFLENDPGSDYISYKRANNRGIQLGRVIDWNKDKKLASIKLDIPLVVGDGIEVWVSQGGRVTTTVGRILLGKENLEEGKAGQTVLIDLPKKVNKGDRVFKTHDQRLIAKAQGTYKQPGQQIPLRVVVEGRLGSPMKLSLTDDQGNTVEVESEFIVEKAEKRPLTHEVLTNQLERLGNTPFSLGEIDFQLDEQIMVPMSVLNQLRRDGVAALEEQRLVGYLPTKVDGGQLKDRFVQLVQQGKQTSSAVQAPRISVAVANLAGLRAAVMAGADQVYLPLEGFRRSGGASSGDKLMKELAVAKQKGVLVILSLPRIIHDQQTEQLVTKMRTILDVAVDKGLIAGVQVGNLGGIQFALEHCGAVPIYGDYHLNAFNSQSIAMFQSLGLKQLALSPELTLSQLEQLANNLLPLEIVVHGSIVMMTTEHCPVGSLLGGGHGRADKCSKPCHKQAYGLKDRMKFVFPMEQDYQCRSYIYNPKKLSMAEDVAQLLNLNMYSWRLELPLASPEEIAETVQVYKNQITLVANDASELKSMKADARERLAVFSPAGFTKGHYYRGVLEN